MGITIFVVYLEANKSYNLLLSTVICNEHWDEKGKHLDFFHWMLSNWFWPLMQML